MSKPESSRRANPISRRRFIGQNATALGGLVLAGPAWAAHHACHTTAVQPVGPFYRTNAPMISRLAGLDEPGQRLVISGTVFSSDCTTPLPNALIEVWQANHAGVYDAQTPGNFTERHAFHLRGLLYTDEQGRYRLDTIMPGRYAIPPGLLGQEQYAGLTRPAHIHMRVAESLHVPLTTQIYFQGDPHFSEDPWASREPSLAIALDTDGDVQRGVFDVVLSNGL